MMLGPATSPRPVPAVSVLTRPLEHAKGLAEQLRVRDIPVLIEPMLSIRPVFWCEADLAGASTLLVTSPSAARLIAQTPHIPRRLKVLAVGSATAEPLRQSGFREVEHARGYAVDLIRLISDRCDPKQAGKLIYMSGSTITCDLTAELEQRGYQCGRVIIYDAHPTPGFTENLKNHLAMGSIRTMSFFSVRTTGTFLKNAQACGLLDKLNTVTAIALSDKIASALACTRWMSIQAVPELSPDAVVGAIARCHSDSFR